MSQLLPDIDHVVVLMLENRSFDNIFGVLYPAGPGFFGLTGQESNYNPDPPGVGTWKVWQAPVGGSATVIPFPDPGEEFTDMNTQLFGTPNPASCPSPTMSGFAANYARQPSSRSFPGYPSVPPVPRDIMQTFRRDNVSVSYALAETYAVSDVWHAAAPVQTISNRTFVHTGTASMKPGLNESRVNNGDYTAGLSFRKIMEGDFQPPVTDTTVFELLDKANPSGVAPACTDWPTSDTKLNWKVYYHDAPLSALCAYVYANWCFTRLYGGNVHRFHEHFHFETNFEYDIRHGILPTYSFIEPAYTSVDYTANCNHPGGAIPDPFDLNAQNFPPPIDVKHGETLLAEVYSALARHPQVFERTLLIVTYDEHGGLYDHMKPGSAVSPFARPVTNFNYDRYGVRVPAILINPRVGTKVFRPTDGLPTRNACGPFVTQLDHTSIVRTLCQQFGLGAPPTPRAATAATLSGLVLRQAEATPEPPKEVMEAASEARAVRRAAPRDPGKTARIRTWFRRRKIDGFPGDHLNNAVFAMFAASWHGRLRSSSYPLREIVDLDADAADRLLAIGIRDTRSLLAAIRAPGGVAKVAAAAGEDALQVLSWEAQADLMRVPGITGDDAYLLVGVGVRSPAELASRGASGLRSRVLKLAARIELDDYRLPLKVVAEWASAAAGVDATAPSPTGR
jgi:phospholipase C